MDVSSPTTPGGNDMNNSCNNCDHCSCSSSKKEITMFQKIMLILFATLIATVIGVVLPSCDVSCSVDSHPSSTVERSFTVDVPIQ